MLAYFDTYKKPCTNIYKHIYLLPRYAVYMKQFRGFLMSVGEDWLKILRRANLLFVYKFVKNVDSFTTVLSRF